MAANIDEPLAVILLIALAVTTVLSMVTVIRFLQWVMRKIMLTRGYIWHRLILPNGVENEKLVKVKSETEIERQFAGQKNPKIYNFNSQYFTRKNGGEPVITSVHNSIAPIDLLHPSVKQEISSDDISNIAIRSFTLGLIAGFNKEKLINLLLIVGLVAILVSAAGAVIGYLTQTQVTGIEASAKTIIDNIANIKAGGGVVLGNSTPMPELRG